MNTNTEVLIIDCQRRRIRLKINGFGWLAIIATLSVDKKLIGAVTHDKELSGSTKRFDLILALELDRGYYFV